MIKLTILAVDEGLGGRSLGKLPWCFGDVALELSNQTREESFCRSVVFALKSNLAFTPAVELATALAGWRAEIVVCPVRGIRQGG